MVFLSQIFVLLKSDAFIKTERDGMVRCGLNSLTTDQIFLLCL